MLRYTGHPFVDVGVATITAASNNQHPEEVNLNDLRAIAADLEYFYYALKPVQSFLRSLDLFKNAHFMQPKMTDEQKKQYLHNLLFAFENDHMMEESDLRCIFFPELAAVMYAHRQHIPLLNGESVSNFSAMGTRGIPVSGVALLAIHAMPLGCFKCGNLLAFHQLSALGDADGGRMNLVLARKAFETNHKAISMMSPNSAEGSLPNFGSYVKTRYVDTILRAKQDSQSRSANIDNITGYYFTNYGPKPNLELVRLDNAVLRFVDAAQQDASTAWNRVIYFGWQRPKGEETASPDERTTATWRNKVYELLFGLPDNARQFIAYLANGRDWRLIEIFLERVMYMERERIEVYRELGDRLAQYILEYENGSPGFYHQLRREKDYTKFRRRIFFAAERVLKAATEKPLFTYDEFILAFEHPGDTYSQWRLARDLIAIRMLEVLHKHQVDMSDLPEITEEETEEE